MHDPSHCVEIIPPSGLLQLSSLHIPWRDICSASYLPVARGTIW